MTDGKGRTRWEERENKSRETRSGTDEPKNVRKPERVVGWRTRCLAESNRIFCHTTWIRRLCTLTPYLLYFSFASLPPLFIIIIFIFLLLVPSSVPPPIWSSSPSSLALRFPLSLSTHAVNLNPPANLPLDLFFSLILSLPPLDYPSSPLHQNLDTHPCHVYKRPLNTEGCVLRHSHCQGSWQGPRYYQPKTSKSLGL